MPFRKLFLSRWAALLWAGGILWTAFDVVGIEPVDDKIAVSDDREVDASGAAVTSADLAILANASAGD